MAETIEALLVTKGHSFEREPFFEMISALRRNSQCGRDAIHWTHVEHPAAQEVLHPDRAARYDVIVFYDMPGVRFTQGDPPFETYDPSEEFKDAFLSLVERGKGLVFLHHAIGGWPTWPEYAKIIGGRFHFLPGELGGQRYPGSGYRFRVAQEVTVTDPSHPIVEGLGESFKFTDEVYMFPALEDDVEPLLRSDFEFSAGNFRHGGVGFESHPQGTSLLGWTRRHGKSPIVFLQPGHERIAYEDPRFRKLVRNAIVWAAQQAQRYANESTQLNR